MALLPQTRVAAEPEPGTRFVPARWLVVAFGISRLLLRGGKLGKLGIAGIAWSLLPRKLKLVAVGLIVAGSLVLAGAMAALALLAMQL